jgi:hypothetical protein
VVYIHNGVLFSHKNDDIMLLVGKWIELGEHYIEQSKPDSKGQRSHIFPLKWKLDI